MLSGLKGRLNSAMKLTQQPKPAAPVVSDCLTLESRVPVDPSAFALPKTALADLFGEDAAADFDIRKCLFLDTETTGLSGGAGTVAFLTGIGWIEGDSFVTRQYFLRSYAEEPFMLTHLAQLLPRFAYVVTFNGKTFDCPLLESRFTMNRMRCDFSQLTQLDLLVPARRIWKLRLEHCKLSILEEKVLGIEREGDIPGSEVPEKYFAYLKTQDLRAMNDVISHNRQDIVTLHILLARMAQLLDSPLMADHVEDIFSIGRVLERNGSIDRAEDCYREASHGRVASRAAASLGNAIRRSENRAAAEDVWLDMIDRGLGGTQPYIELSKLYEHDLHDYPRALDFTERAQAIARAMSDGKTLAALAPRRERLLAKLNKPQ